MTATDPQAERLREALHQRVDGMHDAPLTLDDVRGRARGIRRARRITAGAAVAAALAVVVPLGVAASGQLSADRSLPPAAPVSEAPAPSAEQRAFSTDGLPQGGGTAVPWIDVRAGAVVAGELVVDSVAMPQDAVRWAGGLMVTGIDGGQALLHVLDDAGAPVLPPVDVPDGRVLVASAERREVAWVEESADGGQQAVVSASGDVVDAADQLVVALPDLGGFEPVGIGPDGLVLNATYPDGRAAVVLLDRSGGLRDLRRLAKAVGVHPRTGDVVGRLAGDRPCSGVVAPSTGRLVRAADCELAYRSLSPDGRWITATAVEADGYGDPSLLVVDAATGDLQAGWSSRANPRPDWMQHQWEDAEAVLATVVEGDGASLVRFGLDGSAERVVGPLPQEPYGEQVAVLPQG